MKKCTACNESKEESCFYFKNKKTGKLQSKCKSCSSNYSKKHYTNNKKIYIERARNSNQKANVRNRKFVSDYKSYAGCKVCGENCHVCLDFHHIDSKNKTRNISRMSNEAWSLESIMKEIDKCIVLCSNCHRKLHCNLISITDS
jgi:hypothetical protein